MENYFRKLFLLGIIFSGCMGLSQLSKVEIPTEIGSPYIHHVRVYQGHSSRGPFFLVSGSVRKPVGKKLEQAQVAVSFFDESGKKLIEEISKVNFVSHPRYSGNISGKFSVKVLFLETIKSCSLELIWE